MQLRSGILKKVWSTVIKYWYRK